jgi:hypothetical protein
MITEMTLGVSDALGDANNHGVLPAFDASTENVNGEALSVLVTVI